jgi:hypothetical protein
VSFDARACGWIYSPLLGCRNCFLQADGFPALARRQSLGVQANDVRSVPVSAVRPALASAMSSAVRPVLHPASGAGRPSALAFDPASLDLTGQVETAKEGGPRIPGEVDSILGLRLEYLWLGASIDGGEARLLLQSIRESVDCEMSEERNVVWVTY